jgi:tetratricopeptide (TPR) repeat protein
MFIIKLLPFLFLQPVYADVDVSTSVVVPLEVDSRDAKFESDIAEAEKRINELARKNRLSNIEKSALYRKEAQKALARRDSKRVNKFSKLMSSQEKAIAFFTKEIELNPNPQAYHLRGVAYKQLRQYDKAIKDFTVAIEFKSDKAEYPFEYSRAEAYRLRGNVYKAQKNYAKALGDVNSAIELNPKPTFAFADRCAINLKMGNVKSAVKDAESFFQGPVSMRDKEIFAAGGQCQSLVEAGATVKGCKDLEYFKAQERDLLERARIQREKFLKGK